MGERSTVAHKGYLIQNGREGEGQSGERKRKKEGKEKKKRQATCHQQCLVEYTCVRFRVKSTSNLIAVCAACMVRFQVFEKLLPSSKKENTIFNCFFSKPEIFLVSLPLRLCMGLKALLKIHSGYWGIILGHLQPLTPFVN